MGAKKKIAAVNERAGVRRVPAAERRGAGRVVTILRVGKLICKGQPQLCLVRNIAPGGLMALVHSEIASGSRVDIEMRSDQKLSGEVIWAEGGQIGVSFDAPVEIENILSRPLAGAWKSRPPRVEVAGYAHLDIGGRVYQASVLDLSQGGAKVALDGALTPGEEALLAIEGLRPVRAVVRWSKGGKTGLALIGQIPFEELVHWLADNAKRT